MEEYKISEEIYQASLVTSSESFSISDDIFEEADTLTVEELQLEVLASYNFSGRYWIWKMGSSVFYKNKNWQCELKALNFGNNFNPAKLYSLKILIFL